MRCPITYEPLQFSEKRYSQKGLRLLSKNITNLNNFPYAQDNKIEQAQIMMEKLAPYKEKQQKLKVSFDPTKQIFESVEKGSTFILKLPDPACPFLPENEDLTMRLAKFAGLDIPLHGLVYNRDGSLSFWIRRFDRPSLKSPIRLQLPVETCAQLNDKQQRIDNKDSMENAARIIENHTTFPLLEKEKLFRLTLFNFLVGNGAMQLDDLAFITKNKIVKLAPTCNLINTSLLAEKNNGDEMALSLNSKKNNLNGHDFIDYFAIDFLGIPHLRVKTRVKKLILATKKWPQLIEASFLPSAMKHSYLMLTKQRLKQLLS